ncbi:MAG: hypothetical protein PHD25_08915 [Bacteroidales bacterium]|nr:hypothetical protein [Bacteroidales bacterium]
MRNFVPSDGLFELEFPIKWIYQLKNGYIHQFNFEKGIGSFFISVLGDDGRQTFNQISKNPRVIKRQFNEVSAFEMPLGDNEMFNTVVWMFDVEMKLFQASYTYDAKQKGTDKQKSELKIISDIIGSISIIKEEDREQRIAWYKFGKFTENLVASEELYNHAAKHGCFVQCVCILANQIDAMLRTAIILKDQIVNKNNHITISLIYQGATDKKISEKEIYKLSKEKGIIDQNIFDKLNIAYEDRNKVVHRYIISEFTTKDVLNIAIKYSEIKHKIWQIVYNLETKQLDDGIGMTTTASKLTKEQFEETEQIITTALKEKHGGIDLNNPPS